MYDIFKRGVNLPIALRSWDSYISLLGYGSQHSWNVKLSANRENPRFAIIGFTLNNFSTLKVHFNSESYPYDNLNVDFSRNQYVHLYDVYTRYQSGYYNRESEPFLTPNEFKLKVPIIVTDLSYHWCENFNRTEGSQSWKYPSLLSSHTRPRFSSAVGARWHGSSEKETTNTVL